MSNFKCKCCSAQLVEACESSWDGTLLYETLKCVNDECAEPSEVTLSIKTNREVEY